MLEDTLAPDGTYAAFDDELSYLQTYSQTRSTKYFVRYAYPYVRFYGNVAAQYGNPRISAFIYHIVGVCKGKRDRFDKSTYDPADTFGTVVGIGEKQLRRYVRMLVDEHLIEYRRGKNRLEIWVRDERLWTLNKRDHIYFYNRKLEEKFGINQAILYNVIYRYAHNGNGGFWASPTSVTKIFPWMTYDAAASALACLHRGGYTDYDREGCMLGARRWYPTDKLDMLPGGAIQEKGQQVEAPDPVPTLPQRVSLTELAELNQRRGRKAVFALN